MSESETKSLLTASINNGISDNTRIVNEDFIQEFAQQRSDSMTKWYIVCWLSTVWVAAFHCITSVSALEYAMLEHYSLSNAEFALLSSVVFFAAIPSTLIAP